MSPTLLWREVAGTEQTLTSLHCPTFLEIIEERHSPNWIIVALKSLHHDSERGTYELAKLGLEFLRTPSCLTDKGTTVFDLCSTLAVRTLTLGPYAQA